MSTKVKIFHIKTICFETDSKSQISKYNSEKMCDTKKVSGWSVAFVFGNVKFPDTRTISL